MSYYNLLGGRVPSTDAVERALNDLHERVALIEAQVGEAVQLTTAPWVVSLRRERDEAQGRARLLEEECSRIRLERDTARAMLEDRTEELKRSRARRDQLDLELGEVRDYLEAIQIAHGQEIDERDCLKGQLTEAWLERDEARADREVFRSTLERIAALDFPDRRHSVGLFAARSIAREALGK